MPMEVKYQKIDIKTLNISLDPWHVLKEIGYEKSDPKEVDKELRDYCPIHGGDHQRSLSIDINKKQFKCHNCNARGDLVTLYCLANVLDVRDPKTYQDIAKTFNYTEEPTTGTTDTTVIIAKESREPFDPPPNVEKIWGRYSEDGDHPYIKEKKITRPDGIKFGNDAMGNHSIIVPYRNVEGVLQSLQYITTTGKYFLKGAPTGGSFFTIGSIETAQKLYLCEGLATGVTIYKSLREPAPVVSVGSKSNLPKVFTTLRSKCPQLKIIIALDKGTEDIINKLSDSVTYCVPNFDGMNWDGEKEPTDFNDLISKCGKTIEVVKEQLENVQKLEDTDTIIEKYNEISELNSRAQLHEYFKNLHPGLNTGFALDAENELIIPAALLTTIAAPTGQGKTLFATQLMIETLERNDIDAIFFTLEERAEPILLRFLNCYCQMDLSKNNTRSLEHYYRTESDEYISIEQREVFKEREKAFFDRFISTGKIRVKYGYHSRQEMELAIHFITENHPKIKLIVIDYIQLMNCDERRNPSRAEEIKDITRSLKDMANETGLAIVQNAQFNREVISEFDLQLGKIGEGGDIERSSALVIGMYNRSYKQTRRSGGPEIPQDPSDEMFFNIMKNRKGRHGQTVVKPFSGNQGVVDFGLLNSEVDNSNKQIENNNTPQQIDLCQEFINEGLSS